MNAVAAASLHPARSADVRNMKSLAQKGFSLIELLIVIIVLGIIAAVIYPLVNNQIGSKANAQEMMSVSQNAVRNIALMAQTMRAPTAVTGNPLTASGNNLLDVVVMGDKVSGVVSATYATRYASSGVRPLADAVVVQTPPTAGTPGVYLVGDSTMSLTNIGTRQIGVQLTNVATELVQSIFDKREGGTFNGTAARTTGVVRWTAPVSGYHTMTLVYDL